MSEDPRDKAAALAEGMEAAGALIENLEQEVADLRSDLDRAAVALKAAQEEVSTRAGALEEKERARVEAEKRSPHSSSSTRTSSSSSTTSIQTRSQRCVAGSKSNDAQKWMRPPRRLVSTPSTKSSGVNAKPWRRGPGRRSKP